METAPLAVFTNDRDNSAKFRVAETATKTLGYAYTAENAHLIAAAPELLESLSRLVSLIDRGWLKYHDDSVVIPSDINRARAAIAKAKG